MQQIFSPTFFGKKSALVRDGENITKNWNPKPITFVKKHASKTTLGDLPQKLQGVNMVCSILGETSIYYRRPITHFQLNVP